MHNIRIIVLLRLPRRRRVRGLLFISGGGLAGGRPLMTPQGNCSIIEGDRGRRRRRRLPWHSNSQVCHAVVVAAAAAVVLVTTTTTTTRLPLLLVHAAALASYLALDVGRGSVASRRRRRQCRLIARQIRLALSLPPCRRMSCAQDEPGRSVFRSTGCVHARVAVARRFPDVQPSSIPFPLL